jgi:GxxExxY protein
MDTNKHELVFKNEVFQVVGCAIEVLNTLGHGFTEKPYEEALIVEFGLRSISFKQQPRYNVAYKGTVIGEYVPDLVVYDQIILELKSIPCIAGRERSQLLNYLKATGFKVGLILNFGNAKLEWERLVL